MEGRRGHRYNEWLTDGYSEGAAEASSFARREARDLCP
jgi:hypothetical protein